MDMNHGYIKSLMGCIANGSNGDLMGHCCLCVIGSLWAYYMYIIHTFIGVDYNISPT